MKPHTHRGFTCQPPPAAQIHPRPRRRFNPLPSTGSHGLQQNISYAKRCRIKASVRQPESPECSGQSSSNTTAGRRVVLLTPLLSIGACYLKSTVARADENTPESSPPPPPAASATPTPPVVKVEVKKEDVINSRVYDAAVIGEPMALGKDKSKIWEKLMNARVLYLGEAEQVPTRDDKEVELEIVKNLRKRCLEAERPLSLALEAFPSNLQEQLNQFMDGRIDGGILKSFVSHWPPQCWQDYEPLLNFCRDSEIRLVACGTPLEILRTVQAEGIQGLSKSDRKVYAPPAGSGFISGFTSSISRRSSVDINFPNQPPTFGPSSYLSAQAKVVEDYNMSQVILRAVTDGGGVGMLVVITGAGHVTYGSRGSGVPARISRKIPKKNQVVILLDPERQYIRREGEVPVADFLWYSAARPCSRNCFDRAEIARVMNAAGRRRDALPQDLQKGLDLGVLSPEVLQNFFDLEQYPLISELTHRFQGFRERLLADPQFLNRLAIEESISITTALIAQYARRKDNFFEEIDYVITDTVRGIVVDFFTVWLPAPTISFLSVTDTLDPQDSVEALKGLLGSIPDNAFQKNIVGRDWNLSHRVGSVFVGGLKLASVGFISSIGAVASSNILFGIRKLIRPAIATEQLNRTSPVLKTALVYSSFLGTSANLRYQIIAGLVEHRIADEFASQTLLVNLLSFVVRTINSYWGTQQWIDLARSTGLQTRKTEDPSLQLQESPDQAAALECNVPEEINTDEIEN